ncbi:MAG: hypothetical protein K2X44_10265 [Magnetospirillum sp.]|nr:hypothetical protein [Magnetospirillum sp.]
MNTASIAEPSALNEVAAMAMGLALMCVGTVALIGGTGLMMWVFGL